MNPPISLLEDTPHEFVKNRIQAAKAMIEVGIRLNQTIKKIKEDFKRDLTRTEIELCDESPEPYDGRRWNAFTYWCLCFCVLIHLKVKNHDENEILHIFMEKKMK